MAKPSNTYAREKKTERRQREKNEYGKYIVMCAQNEVPNTYI